MKEFNDIPIEICETEKIEIPDSSEEFLSLKDISDFSQQLNTDNNDILSAAERAAEYARSYGFDKAAD